MKFQEKIDSLDAKQRIKDIEKQEAKEDEARKRAQKNDDFFMVFRPHAAKIEELIRVSPPAAQIFMFLAKHVDRTNAIVASGKALATHLKLSEATISRALKILTAKDDETGKGKYLEILKTGQSNVFILNPDIVWNAWATGKNSCLFGNAKILVSLNEQDSVMKKRLTMLLNSPKQMDLINTDDGSDFQPFSKVLEEKPNALKSENQND